jgi:putative redox protein
MAQEANIRATWKTGVEFEVDDDTGHHLTIDVDQQDGGQNAGFRPMTMLLVGLAGCMGVSVLPILLKKRQDVSGYELRIRGVRAPEHPKVFTEITIEHIVTGHGVQNEAVRRSIELAETKYCGASAMLGKTATITNTFQVVEAG